LKFVGISKFLKMLARDSIDQRQMFEDPFSIPAENSLLDEAMNTFLLPSSGRSAAKAASLATTGSRSKSPELLQIDGAKNSKETLKTHMPTSFFSFSCRPPALPPRSAPLQLPPKILNEAEPRRRRRLSATACPAADADPAPAVRGRHGRWERAAGAGAGRKHYSVSADSSDADGDAAPPPPGHPGCRARYNFQVGLSLVLDDLRLRRREAAAAAAAAATCI
jgi:hypothetical protein